MRLPCAAEEVELVVDETTRLTASRAGSAQALHVDARPALRARVEDMDVVVVLVLLAVVPAENEQALVVHERGMAAPADGRVARLDSVPC